MDGRDERGTDHPGGDVVFYNNGKRMTGKDIATPQDVHLASERCGGHTPEEEEMQYAEYDVDNAAGSQADERVDVVVPNRLNLPLKTAFCTEYLLKPFMAGTFIMFL